MLWSSSPTANTAALLPAIEFEPRVLQFVGVLELVDQNVVEAVLVVLAQDFVACSIS